MKREAKDDAIAFQAAGVAFYMLLALVPAIAAVVAIYGLIADRDTVLEQVSHLYGVMPTDVVTLIKAELTAVAKADTTASWTLVIAIGLALWGASKGMGALSKALNTVYDETENRSFFAQKLINLGLTLGALLLATTVITLAVVIPMAIEAVGFGDSTDTLMNVLRWPALVLTVIVSLAAIYRYAPSRRSPKWRWVTPGSAVAALLWVGACAGFSFYASSMGNFTKTYGSLTAVVLLMFWLYITALAVLLGGELNAETEHQTLRDSTVGAPRPLGERGAYVADTIGKPRETPPS